MIGAGERADGRQQARPRDAGRHAGRQVGFADLAAGAAGACKQAVFRHRRRDWRQVGHLMPGDQAGDLHGAAAGGAWTGSAIVRLGDLIGRQQDARLARMAGLGATLSAAGRFRRRWAIRVGGGWLRGIMRIGTQFLFQNLDALRQLAHHQPQFVDQRLGFFECTHLRRRLPKVDLHGALDSMTKRSVSPHLACFSAGPRGERLPYNN